MTNKKPSFKGKNTPGRRLERGYIRVLKVKKAKKR